MKRTYVCFEPHRQADGSLTLDADGASYLKPHSHKLLSGKEFVNELAIVQTIQDHNRENPGAPLTGEVIILQVLTF
jgi:hypothetical protein